MNTSKEKIFYEVDFGMGSYGKVIKLNDGTFQCFETPIYGGNWIKCGNPFLDIKDAIKFLNSLT